MSFRRGWPFLRRHLLSLDPNMQVVLLLLAIMLTRGVLYALVDLPFDAPDESGHYDYVRSLYHSGGAKVEGAEINQPPLYYWISLPAFALAANRSPFVGLLTIRLVSVLMSVGVVALAYMTARTLCPKDRLVYLGTPAFVGLVPEFGLLGGSANNDNLANLAGAAMIFLLVRGISIGFAPTRSFALIGFIGVAVGAKAIVWPVAVVAFLVLVARGVSWGLARNTKTTLTFSIFAFLSIALGLIGPAGPRVEAALKAVGLRDDFFSAERFLAFASGLDAPPFIHQFRTFWGTFGNDTIHLPDLLYGALALLLAISVLGLLVRIAGALRTAASDRALSRERRVLGSQILVLGGSAFLVWLLSFLRLYRESLVGDRPGQPFDALDLMQGRFLFPAIVPIGFFFVWGLGALLPDRWRRHGTAVLFVLLLATDWTAFAVLLRGSYSWQP